MYYLFLFAITTYVQMIIIYRMQAKIEELEDYKRKYMNILKGEQNNERY